MYEQVVCLSAAGSPEDLDEKRVRGKERRGGEAGPAYRVKMEGGGEEWGRILEAGTKHGEEGKGQDKSEWPPGRREARVIENVNARRSSATEETGRTNRQKRERRDAGKRGQGGGIRKGNLGIRKGKKEK